MKTKLPLVIALASVLGAPLAGAQDERPPTPPQPPAGGEPRGPRPEGERRPGPPEGHERFHGERHGEPRRGEGEMRRGEGEGRGYGEGRPRAQKPTPYLGVMSVPVPPALGAQLGLAEGFGIVVEEVVPDSPAAAAGLQKHDVIKSLDDQQLVGPDQLAALVRSRGKDQQVTLVILRKGHEQKLNVRIGERMLPERRPMNTFGMGDFMPRAEEWRERAEDAARRMRENLSPEEMRERTEQWSRKLQGAMRGFQERMQDYQRKLEEWRKNPGDSRPPEPPKFEQPPGNPGAPGPRDGAANRPPQPPAPADLLRETRPGGVPQVRVDQDGGSTTWNTAQARVVMKDDSGEIEVRTENGRRTVVAKDPHGETIYTGPIDTEEQRQALPAPIREKLARIHLNSRRGPDGAGAQGSFHRPPVDRPPGGGPQGDRPQGDRPQGGPPAERDVQ